MHKRRRSGVVLPAVYLVVACIVVIGAVGTKVLARWTSVNSGM